MRIESADAAFIRARRCDIHPVLLDVAGYGRWWPGATSVGVGDEVRLELRPPGVLAGPLRRRQRLTVRVRRNRPDRGLHLACLGTLSGETEWYYLDEPAGVVVTYLVRAEVPDRGWSHRLRDHRACVRLALHALKDRLERTRLPGDEPAAALVEHQRRMLVTEAVPGRGPRP
jgi:hypothetical protein